MTDLTKPFLAEDQAAIDADELMQCLKDIGVSFGRLHVMYNYEWHEPSKACWKVMLGYGSDGVDDALSLEGVEGETFKEAAMQAIELALRQRPRFPYVMLRHPKIAPHFGIAVPTERAEAAE